MNIIVKNYSHYNRALGKYIRTKQEYDYEMKSRGFVSFEEGQRLAESKNKEKKWVPSEKCIGVVSAITQMGDKKGNIVLGNHPRLVKAMEQGGVKFTLPDWCPKHYREGGFNASEDGKIQESGK